ncbi:MAG TPA: hypothetical protein VGP46_08905, partial [Acidimicrobiales bacterium]|nr:hypothetical protein [Acidimicrobiales bacterium]
MSPAHGSEVAPAGSDGARDATGRARSMRPRLLVLTEEDSLDAPDGRADGADGVVLLFWCAPESAAFYGRGSGETVRLADLLPAYDGLMRAAFAHTHDLVEKVSPYRGVNALLPLENVLCDEVLRAWIVAAAFRQLLARFGAGTVFTFPTDSVSARLFSLVNRAEGSPATVLVESGPAAAGRRPPLALRWTRSFRDLAVEAALDRDWRRVVHSPLEVVDASYRLRTALPSRRPDGRGGRWLYSSYVNYSRILSRHGKGTDRWLTNNYSARSGLPAATRSWPLWAF